MVEKLPVITPSGKEMALPDMPEVSEIFVRAVYNRARDPEFSVTHYGHAAMGLAAAAIGQAELETDPVKQTNRFRRTALETIKQFGPNINPLLCDELKLALTEKDFACILPEESE